MDGSDVMAEGPRQSSKAVLLDAFSRLTADERQLLVCALAGNHPPRLAPLRMEVLRGLAKADRAALEDELRWCGDGQEGVPIRKRLAELSDSPPSDRTEQREDS